MPPSIESFDGKSWAGVAVGQTRDPELKGMYRVFKSKLYPEALSIDVPDGSHTVDALLDRRGGIATVQGFLLQYPLGGPSEQGLAAKLGEEPTRWYHPRRIEAWHVVAFIKSGVVLFVDETEFGPSTRSVLLCNPASVQNGISEMLSEKTEVGELDDPGQGWDRTAKVSGVQLSATGSASVPQSVFKNLRHEVEEIAIDQGTGPRIHYVRRSSNTYYISLVIHHNTRRNKFGITAKVRLKVDTPYGDAESSVMHVEHTSDLTKTRVLGAIRAGIVSVNRSLGSRLSGMRPKEKSVETSLAIERFLRLATVPPP